MGDGDRAPLQRQQAVHDGGHARVEGAHALLAGQQGAFGAVAAPAAPFGMAFAHGGGRESAGLAEVVLHQPRLLHEGQAEGGGDGLGGGAGAREGAGDDAIHAAVRAQAFGQGARLFAPQRRERRIEAALDDARGVALGLAVAHEQERRHGATP